MFNTCFPQESLAVFCACLNNQACFVFVPRLEKCTLRRTHLYLLCFPPWTLIPVWLEPVQEIDRVCCLPHYSMLFHPERCCFSSQTVQVWLSPSALSVCLFCKLTQSRQEFVFSPLMKLNSQLFIRVVCSDVKVQRLQ